MPLSAGFVGVIPALEKLLKPEEGGPINLSLGQLVVWSLGVCFFGVFFAVPCRCHPANARKCVLGNWDYNIDACDGSKEAGYHEGEAEVSEWDGNGAYDFCFTRA